MIFQAHGECMLNAEQRHGVRTEVVLGDSFCELDTGGRDGCCVGGVCSDRSFADCAATRLTVR
jgi:hypothetical protein